MSIELSPENEQFVRQVVHEGSYRDSSDVLNAAVELLRQRRRLVAHIDAGLEDLESGRFTDFDDDSLRSYFENIQTREDRRAQ